MPLHFIDQGVVSPVGENMTEDDRKDYNQTALDAFSWRGKTWGWPWCSKCDALFLNLDLFSKGNVEPPKNGRWTLAQFTKAAKELTKDTNGDGEIDEWGVNFCLSLGRTAEYGFMLQPGGKFLSNSGKALALAEEKEGLEGLQLLRDLTARYKVAPPEAGGQTPKDVWLAFYERQSTAIMPCGLWALKALRKKQPFAYTMAHFPDGPDGKPRVIASTAGYYVFRRPNEPEREKMAHKLARFLTLGVNQKILRQYGQFPTRKSAGKLYLGDKLMERAEEICQYSSSLPTTPLWPRIDETLKRNLQVGVLGDKSVDDCGRELARKCADLLSKSEKEHEASNLGEHLVSIFGLLVTGGLLLFLYSIIKAKKRQRTEELIAWTFLLPSLAVLGLFFAYPAFRAVLLAFQDYRIHQGIFDNFVGLKHFFAILIPNAEFITARVSNWTFGDRLRRIDIPVGVAYASDPKKVIGVLEKVARANPRVLSTPAPFCFFMNYGDSSINFELRVWTDQSSDYIQLRSELNAAVYDAVKAAGMSFPFPQREIRLLSDPDPRVSLSSQTDEPLASENRSDDSGNRSA